MSLADRYQTEVVKKLCDEFGYKNRYQVPRVEKVVLSTGVGEAIQNPKALESQQYALAAISGQRPIVVRAKRSEAGFKLRKGMQIACSVTMRKKRMYDFLERLITIALPRVRDFKGISRKSFDGHGNYNFGIREEVVFPEVDIDKLDKVRGFNVTIVTSAKTDKEALCLLENLGLPFRK